MEIGDISKSYLYGIALRFLLTRLWACQIRKLVGAFFVPEQPFRALFDSEMRAERFNDPVDLLHYQDSIEETFSASFDANRRSLMPYSSLKLM